MSKTFEYGCQVAAGGKTTEKILAQCDEASYASKRRTIDHYNSIENRSTPVYTTWFIREVEK